jgi:PAS domain S-box-containing protein
MIDYSCNYYTLVYSVSVLITAFLVLVSWKRKSDRVGTSFFYLSLFLFYWSLIGAVESAVITPDLKVILSKFDYIGAIFVPFFFLIFSLSYNKLDFYINTKNIFLVLAVPIFTLILVFTNEYHGLIWSSYYLSDYKVGLVHPIVYRYGLWFWFVHLTYSYTLLFLGSFLFIKNFLKLKKPHSYQVSVILIGVLIPLLANIFYISGFFKLPGLDITRISFSITGILFVIAIFYWKFLDLIPLARSLLVEKMSDGLIVVDRANKIIDINPSALSFFNLKNNFNALGRDLEKVFSFCPDLKKIIEISKSFRINFKKQIEINKKYFDLSVEQLFDKDNKPYGRLFVFRDISRMKSIEDKLKEERERAQKYLDIAKVILLALDKEGNVLMVNKKGLEISGFKKEELIGKNWFKICLPKEEQERVLTFFKKLVSGKIKKIDEAFENEILSKKGEKILVAWISTFIRDDQGKIIGVLSSGEDITIKRKNEEIIKENSRKLGRLLHHLKLATESAQIGIWDLNLKTKILTWDDQMYKLYGVKRGKFDGKFNSWKKICHPDDLARVEKEIDVAISSRSNFNSVFRIVFSDNSIKYIKAFANVVFDKKNRPYKMIGVNFDVTEEKEIDRAKSEFVSLASHQLRTPLTAINWYTEMLLEDNDRISEEQRSYLEEIHTSNQHLVGLVNSLLNVSRIEVGSLMISPEKINLVELVNDVIRFHKVIIGSKKIKFYRRIAKNIPLKFSADKRLLGIVFQNILSNSINYTPDGGSIHLSLSLDRSKKNIVFKVTDNGYGIPKNQQAKIFTKLFRADNAQKIDTSGTGLGLYIVKSIVDKSGGKIWFESAENKGTSFYVSFPLKGMNKIVGFKSLL